MEAYTGALKPEFILSTGDSFYDGPMPVTGTTNEVPNTPANLQAADRDVIWDLSFRHIYDRPNLRATPWYLQMGNHGMSFHLFFAFRGMPHNKLTPAPYAHCRFARRLWWLPGLPN